MKFSSEKFWSGPKFGCIQNNLDQSKIVLDLLKDKAFSSDESEPSWLDPELELKDFQLGLARVLFPFSSKSAISRKRAEI